MSSEVSYNLANGSVYFYCGSHNDHRQKIALNIRSRRNVNSAADYIMFQFVIRNLFSNGDRFKKERNQEDNALTFGVIFRDLFNLK